MSSALEYDFFAARRGRTFTIQFVSRAVDLVLVDVTALPPPRSVNRSGDPVPAGEVGRQHPFSLLFRGPADVCVAQGTYPLRVDGGDPIAIFIVPVSRDADGYRYEAIFS